MLTIANTLLPVFALVALGMVIERMRIMPDGTAAILNQFVFNIGMPALIFIAIATKQPAELARIGYIGGTVAGMFASFVLVYGLFSGGFRRRHGESGMLSLLASFPNTAFLGLPVLVALFPGNEDAVLASSISTILGLPLLMLVIGQQEYRRSADGTEQQGLARKLARSLATNPILLSTVTGVAVCLGRVPLPASIEGMFRMLGGTASPCALFAIGMVLANQLVSRKGDGAGLLRQIPVNAVKLLGQPVVTFLSLKALGVDGAWLAMGVILSGMPTGTIAYVLAENYGTCTGETSRAILANTAASMLTIPLTIAALQHMHLL